MWKAILGLIKLLFGQRETGRMEQQHADMKQTIDNVEKAHEVERRLDAADDAERERLRDKWTRGA